MQPRRVEITRYRWKACGPQGEFHPCFIAESRVFGFADNVAALQVAKRYLAGKDELDRYLSRSVEECEFIDGVA